MNFLAGAGFRAEFPATYNERARFGDEYAAGFAPDHARRSGAARRVLWARRRQRSEEPANESQYEVGNDTIEDKS